MSCRVLVITEDPTHNGAILKPLVRRMLEACGKPKAIVHVPTNPRCRGYAHAKSLLPGILRRYQHFDLALFLVDADGKDHGAEFTALESGSRPPLLCCAARQEVEIWLLAGHRERVAASWQEIRSEVSLKERFFQPFLDQHGSNRPDGGRGLLMAETLANYTSLKTLCPEIAELETRVRAQLADTP